MEEKICRICGKYIPNVLQSEGITWPVHYDCYDKALEKLVLHHAEYCHDCNDNKNKNKKKADGDGDGE